MRQKLVALALAPVVSAAAWLAPGVFAGSPADAAPPGEYDAVAHGDLYRLDALDALPAVLPGGGSVADLAIAHARSAADSNASQRATAQSSNLEATVLFGNVPIDPDSEQATAPPTQGPRERELLAVPLDPVVDVGAITGEVYAADAEPCVPAAKGRRVVAHGVTSIAPTTVLGTDTPGLEFLARMGEAQADTSTALVDRTDGGAAVEAVTRTSIGDIQLIGGAATVRVESPVVLRGRSDGTVATAGFDSPPTVTVKVGPEVIDIPLNGQPVDIPVGIPDNPALTANVQITGFTPTDSSSGSHAEAELVNLLEISAQVGLAGQTVAQTTFGVAPMRVAADAPAGGVDCQVTTASDPDGDGLSSSQEGELGTDPNDADTDDDGLDDGKEVGTHLTDPTDADTDDDQLPDGAEIGEYGTDPLNPDTDHGGVPDGTEVTAGTNPLDSSDDSPLANDADGDGLTDIQEATSGTDPADPDTDGDGLEDGEEIQVHDTSPTVADSDGDGLTDGAEVKDHHTSPVRTDSDDDGLDDGAEVKDHGTDPTRADTDGDALTDGAEVNGLPGTLCRTNPRRKDTDRDKLKDGKEFRGFRMGKKVRTRTGTVRIGKVRTNPCVKDTDGDRIKDGKEVKGFKVHQKVVAKDGGYFLPRLKSNPAVADSDRDGLRDRAEITGAKNKKFGRHKTNPLDYDTDRGGIGDGREVAAGADPADVRVGPQNSRRMGPEALV